MLDFVQVLSRQKTWVLHSLSLLQQPGNLFYIPQYTLVFLISSKIPCKDLPSAAEHCKRRCQHNGADDNQGTSLDSEIRSITLIKQHNRAKDDQRTIERKRVWPPSGLVLRFVFTSLRVMVVAAMVAAPPRVRSSRAEQPRQATKCLRQGRDNV